jgi:hypothetical protein
VFDPKKQPSKHAVIQHLKTLFVPEHALIPSSTRVVYTFHGTNVANVSNILGGSFHALFRNDGFDLLTSLSNSKIKEIEFLSNRCSLCFACCFFLLLGGFFGAGVYTSPSLEYAAHYAVGTIFKKPVDATGMPQKPEDPPANCYPVLLAAMMVAHAYPITSEPVPIGDYPVPVPNAKVLLLFVTRNVHICA